MGWSNWFRFKTRPGPDEYQQVAALACHQIDLLAEIANNPNLSADELRQHIEYAVKWKDEITTDAKTRRRRYESICMLFAASASGMIREDAINPDGTIKR